MRGHKYPVDFVGAAWEFKDQSDTKALARVRVVETTSLPESAVSADDWWRSMLSPETLQRLNEKEANQPCP